MLQSDCSSCFGMCCVLLPFSRESGFGATKRGGVPCHHLDGEDRCSIHATLRADGWPGCAAFECFGAGQRVSQVTYGGISWREQDNLGEMSATFSVMRALHEMLLHLGEADRRGAEIVEWVDRLVGFTRSTPEELLRLDLDRLRESVGALLAQVSAEARSDWPQAPDLTRADLAGRDLRHTDLRGASLRGAVLIATDLRGVALTDTDLLGCDARDADVRGADLTRALFLTQPQTNVMRGDAATEIPDDLARPSHWG